MNAVSDGTVAGHQAERWDKRQDKHVPQEKISSTVDAAVLAEADADAKAAGLNRPELIERALRNEHHRRVLDAFLCDYRACRAMVDSRFSSRHWWPDSHPARPRAALPADW